MNNPLESSHTRTMSTDSMPSNVSEDYSYIPNKHDPYQLQSFISLERKVLSDFNRSNYLNGCQKKVSNPNNQTIPYAHPERRGLNNVNSEIFMAPKVHIPYQSHQKKIIKQCRAEGRERQTVALDRVENRKREERRGYVSNDQTFLKNRLKRLPLDMPLQISPKPDMTIDLGQLSQKKPDIHRQSRSFDEGYEKHPNELLGVSRIQKLQSPKTFTYCLPKVISVDKASENFLSGGTSQLSESNIENKNPLNGSSLMMNDDKLKSKLSPEGKTTNKFVPKEEFNFTNILIDAEKKLNQTPQQSTSRFSPKKVMDDGNALKGELMMIQPDPLYYVEIEQVTPSQNFVIEQENKSGSHSAKGRVGSVPQGLINMKSTSKNSKENKKPVVSTSSHGKKSTKHVWSNYTQQVRKEMKQNFPIKENKKLLINTLFEFDPTSPSNVHSSGMDSNTSNLERPTAGNSKPSTFYTMIEERHTEKPKKSSKKDESYDSMEISLPLQIDHSRNDPSVISITNREKPGGSMREDQGKSCDEIYQRSGQKKENNNNNNSSFLTYDQERIISKDNFLQMHNRDFEVNQSASSLRSRKDEDLSEFIRIELGLSQEEQVFQPPCLIRTSFLLKKGISQALKEIENNEKSIEQEGSEQLSSAYNSNTVQNAYNESHSEIKGLEEQSYLNKSSNGNPLSSFNGMDRSNLSNLNPDIIESFTTNEHPKASRRVASKGYSKQGNFVKYFNTSNATIESRNENYSTQSKSSKEFTVPFDELTNNIISNKKMIDLLNRKNESMLLQMLEKSGMSGTNSSSDENALHMSIRALLQAEHQKNLQSVELFRSSNRLPTIEEMNSVHMQLNTKPDNIGLSEPEKVRVSVSHFSDRCISEPNGFCFKKTLIYEPDLISKSFDDVNCLGYFSNKVINQNYLNPHDEAQENDYHSHSSPRMRKSQSESKIASLQLVQRLFLQSQKMNMEGTQGIKSFKTPTGQMQRLKSFIQTGDTIIQSRNRRGNSAKSISRIKDFSIDCRDNRSMSRTHHSKRSSVAADRSRDISKFAFTLIEAPQNIQTYTIIDKPKRSASSDPSKRKINGTCLSSTHLTPIHMNLQKKVASQSNLLICKEHQKNIKENFGKTH